MADPVRELVIKVSIEADEKPLENVGKASDQVSTKAVALGTVIGNVVTKLGEMAVAAVRAGGAMLKDLVFGTAEAADQLAKTANRLDVNTTALQRMNGAIELSGGSAQDLSNGLRDLQKNLGEAITKGTGPGVEGLAALGIEVAEVDSLLSEGDIEGALGLIGDRANALGDSSVKSAALLKVFGGAGEALEPLLEAGSEGIREMGDRIAATGEIIDEKALASFEAMQDNLRDIEGRVQGAKNQIAVALAPAVSDIADRVEEWIDQNQDFIQQDLPAILEGLGTVLIDTTTFLLELLSSWREFIRDASDLAEIIVGDVNPALEGVGGAFDSIGAAVDGVALGVADLTVQLLEAVGASEELINVFKEIRSAISGDDNEIRVQRGAGAQFQRGAALEGGGAREEGRLNGTVDRRFLAEAESTGDTAKLRKIERDPRFTEAAQATARAKADQIEANTAAAAERDAEATRQRRAASIQASRDRARSAQRSTRRLTARQAPRRGGAPAQPSIEELIAGAAGTPGGATSTLRSAASALSGTIVANTDNRIQITIAPRAVDVGGVSVSAELPAQIGQATREEIERIALGPLTTQIRDALETAQTRRNVGP